MVQIDPFAQTLINQQSKMKPVSQSGMSTAALPSPWNITPSSSMSANAVQPVAQPIAPTQNNLGGSDTKPFYRTASAPAALAPLPGGANLGTVPSGFEDAYKQAQADIAARGTTPSPTTTQTETPSASSTTTSNTPTETYDQKYKRQQEEQKANDAAIRAQQQEMINKQLAALDQIYAVEYAKAQQEGQRAVQQQQAVSTVRGGAGSTFAASQQSKVEEQNAAVRRAIDAEKAAKAAEIISGGEKQISQAIKDARAQAEAERQSYLTGQTTEEAKATSKFTTLAQSGVSYDQLDPATKQILAGKYGSEDAAKQVYGALGKGDVVEVGGSLVEKNTGKVIYQAPVKAEKPDTQVMGKNLYERGTDGVWKLVVGAGTSGTGTGGGIKGDYVQGTDPVVDSWVQQINTGKAKITNVPAAYKNKVVVAMNSVSGGKLNAVNLNLQEAKSLVEELKNHPGRTTATGLNAFLSNVPATDAKDFANKVERLQALLFLNAVPQMRGLGAMTEREGAKLDASSSILKDRYTAEGTYLNELNRLGKNLDETLKATGGNVQPAQTEDPQIQELRNQGYSEAQIQQIINS